MDPRRSVAGYTLVEILIVLVVVSILVGGLLTVMGWNQRSVYVAGQTNKAVAVAQEKIDWLTMVVLEALDDGRADEVLAQLAAYDPVGYRGSYSEAGMAGSGDRTIYFADEIEQVVEGEDPVRGVKLTVVRFYLRGGHHVKLAYFIEY